MWTRAAAGTPCPANDLPGLDGVPGLDQALREVRVARLPAAAVVDHDRFAVTALNARKRHPSRPGGLDVGAISGGDVDAVVEPWTAGQRIVPPAERAVHCGRHDGRT